MDFKKKMKKFFTMTRKAEGGFTLVELIVVIAILAILAGVTVPAYGGYVEKAQMAADQQTLATMNTAFTVACMDNGEYDMTNLSFRPVAKDIQTAVKVNDEVNTEFQTYFGDGVFQYYDVLGFDSSKGVFVANTVAAIKEALKAAVSDSNYKKEGVLKNLMDAFDMVGLYFSGNHELFPNGFSLDKLLEGVHEDVRNKFNFGEFDMEFDEILARYCADMTDEEIKKLTDEEKNAIKGNAYVMRFAEDAYGKNATNVLADVTELLGAAYSKDRLQTYKDYYETYIGGKGSAAGMTEQELVEKIELGQGQVPAQIVAGVGTSNVKNDSGVTTLGSLYALAAGFYNSSYTENMTNKPTDFSSFGTVMDAMSVTDKNGKSLFMEYINSGAGEKDVNAYLKAMEYISTGNYEDMTSSNLFASSGLEYLLGALGPNN